MFEAASSQTTPAQSASSHPAPSSTPSSTPAPAASPASSSTPAANPASSGDTATKATGLDRIRQVAAQKKAQAASQSLVQPPTADGATADPASPSTGEKPVQDPAKPAWTPNWKFKVMDKEHEIPEWIRSAAQTPEHEKQLRELHEKALGLDVVKPRLAESQQQLKRMMPEYQKLEASRTELVNHYRRGDMDAFLQTLGIPEEKMLQWAVKKAQLYQMPPEQRQVHEEQAASERRAYQAEQQLAQVRNQQANDSTNAIQERLQLELAKPEIAEIAKFVDEKAGKPHFFIRKVIEAGESHWYRTKQVLTPAQAVQMVMAEYAGFKPQAPAVTAQTPAETGTQAGKTPEAGLIPPAPAPGAKPQAFATKPASTGQQAPHLPNVAAKTGSPVGGPKPRSIDDLRKIRKERFGA